MGRTVRHSGLFALALLLSGVSAASDEATLGSYTLSIEKVRDYAAATKALTHAMERDKALQAEVDAMGGEAQESVAELKAKLAHHPKVLAYYQHQALSLDDAALLPLVATNALTALDTPPDPAEGAAASAGQIEFARAHRAELEAVFMAGGNAQD